MADTGAERLIAIEVEKIIDLWDPWRVDAKNLPFLAWAMGVNLWEDNWSETDRRSWVARQWTLKSLRGTQEGLREFVAAVGGELKRVIAPPALTFTGKRTTDAERAAYVARFPQVRLYPFVARKLLPWSCFLRPRGRLPRVKNGSYLGPRRNLYPTNADAGGRYTRTATLWDRGVETPLTFRHVVAVDVGPYGVREYDEVVLPARRTNKFFIGETDKFLYHPTPGLPSRAIFLGAMSGVASRVVRVPRDGSLELFLPKAQYQTILPDEQLLTVHPESVGEIHPTQFGSLFAHRKQYLAKKYLPPSIAWLHLFERWYIFDQTRVPDARKRATFIGFTRFGIHKYTAEAKIKAFNYRPPRYVRRHVWGFLRPRQDEVITRLRRGVRASMALRDTVLIDTKVMRQLEIHDVPLANGLHVVGELIEG